MFCGLGGIRFKGVKLLNVSLWEFYVSIKSIIVHNLLDSLLRFWILKKEVDV
jgi:hypothetical protein